VKKQKTVLPSGAGLSSFNYRSINADPAYAWDKGPGAPVICCEVCIVRVLPLLTVLCHFRAAQLEIGVVDDLICLANTVLDMFVSAPWWMEGSGADDFHVQAEKLSKAAAV